MTHIASLVGKELIRQVHGHAFFNTAVGHAYSLNTDIREPSSTYGIRVFYSTTHVSLLRRSATPTARIWHYSLQGPGARGMSLLETSSLKCS